MHFGDLLKWAVHTAESQAKQTALQQVQKAVMQLNTAIDQHSPDVADAAKAAINTAVAHIVSGLLTKKN